MVEQIIAVKLESLRRCLARVEAKTPASAEALENDPDLQDILVLNLTRAVQICVDIGSHILRDSGAPTPGSMGEVFSLLASEKIISTELATRLRKAVGFRNIAVHNYETIDWEIVFAVAHLFKEDLREFAESVLPGDHKTI